MRGHREPIANRWKLPKLMEVLMDRSPMAAGLTNFRRGKHKEPDAPAGCP
ncbi:hypothetical protein N183_08740 [Sinorhizobium sp. Sb3]|nr:hypothetical protein N183_08740 [Sinorhizobium sp. Sb3]